MTKQMLFSKAVEILKLHDAKKIGVFGSFAREEESSTSDLDLMIEFSKEKSLLDLVGIEQELSEQLGIKVDLLTELSISPYIIGQVKRDLKIIYER